MKKIAIFASGSGSNFQAIIDEVQAGTLQVEVALLICDKPQAKVIERAKKANIPTFAFLPKEYESKAAFEAEIVRQLNDTQIDYVVLAGYMRLVGETLLGAYEGKIINIHPSLLPSFPGVDAIGQAYRAGVKITGVTIHYVDEGMDTGPIIAQQAIDITEKDKLEDIEKKIHEVEHVFYPETLRKLIQN